MLPRHRGPARAEGEVSITTHKGREIAAASGARCLLCLRHWRRRGVRPGVRPVPDHCHTCGADRGKICAPCNGNLGHYERALRDGRTGSIDYYFGGLPLKGLRGRSRAIEIAIARAFLPLKVRERRAWWRYRARI